MSDARDVHALAAAYFDGALDAADEARALDHLATCARCQAELGDVVGLHVAIGDRAAAAAPPARPRRTVWYAAAGALAIAAAVVVWIAIGRRGATTTPAPLLALADQRAVEARFSAAPFDRYRPYAVARGAGGDREPIPLAALAELERRGDTATLAAALASSGDRARAAELAARLPAGADGDSDRAAIALVAGDPERALTFADAALAIDPRSTRARWNDALARRALGLPYGARAAFHAVAAAGEPGWRDEAAARERELDGELRARTDGVAAIERATAALIAGTGPAIDPAAARAFPTYGQIAFHDALRVAGSRDEAQALAPLADELDRASGTGSARAALGRVAAGDFALRRRFQAGYRALAAGTASAAQTQALLDALAHAGPAVADLRVGALLLAGQGEAHVDEVAKLAGDDPWMALAATEVRIGVALRDDAPGAEAGAVAAIDACDARAWPYRCGALELDLAVYLVARGRYVEAEAHAETAARLADVVGTPLAEDNARVQLAELARIRGRDALARARFEELIAGAGGDAGCAVRRFAQVGLAQLAVLRDDLDGARAALPAPDACNASPDLLGFTVVVDLAHRTDAPDDRARAGAWLAAVAAARDPLLDRFAAIARARLLVDRDPAAGEAALAAAQAGLGGDDPSIASARTWAWSSRLDLAAARSDWAAVLALADDERGRAHAADHCTLVASVDDDRVVVAARGAHGALVGDRARAPVHTIATRAIVPAPVLAALDGCAAIDVIARPPLHGRPDLLPPALPWRFLGDRAAAPAAPTGAPRRVIVADAATPARLGLPRLAPPRAIADATVVTGAAATPARVLALAADATYLELHVHGIADVATSDASFLALAPDPDGRFALTASDVRKTALRGAPIVVLAACRAADVAPYLRRRWSLPDAFLAAGARAVIAADVDLPDDGAAALFEDLRARLDRGEPPAAALAAARSALTARGQAWAGHLMLFE